MQRWHTRFEHEGYEGLFDRRRGVPSPKRVPLATVEEVLRLYQEQYFDFNVRHFHEKLVEEHKIRLSYTWVKAFIHRFDSDRRLQSCQQLIQSLSL
jgi:hypothetical protein